MARPREGDKRELIMETATAVFGEQGFTSTTIKDIAEKAGIAPGSIYTYFADKEELFRATVGHGWQTLLDEIRALQGAPQDFTASFRRLIDVGMDLLKKAFPLLRGMLFDASRMNLLQQYLQELFGEIDKLIIETGEHQVLRVNPDRSRRLTGVKVVVLGTLMAASLTSADLLEAEIEALKTNLMDLVLGSLDGATSQ